MQPVFIRKQYRYPVRSGLWGAYVVDDDPTGTWLFTPKSSTYRSEQDGKVLTQNDCGRGSGPDSIHVLHRSPRRGWWFARWDERHVFYVDIARPTEVVGHEWRYDDLYLDLYQPGDTPIRVDDEDEFEAAWAAGEITRAERDIALTTKDTLLAAIAVSSPPFDDSPWERLREFAALDLPPVTDLPPLL